MKTEHYYHYQLETLFSSIDSFLYVKHLSNYMIGGAIH